MKKFKDNKNYICTYKKCGKNGAICRKSIKGQYICDTCYKIIRDKVNKKNHERRQDPAYLDKQREYDNNWKKRRYRENKNNDTFLEKRREQHRNYMKKMRDKGDISVRFKSLVDNARSSGGTDLTREELQDIIDTQNCYISGVSLKKASQFLTSSYFLDRIGLISSGGNGINGGNYNKDNVKPAIFAFNQLREHLKLSAEEMCILFEPIRNSIDPEIQNILNKIISFSLKKIKGKENE